MLGFVFASILLSCVFCHPPFENPNLFEGDLVLSPDQHNAIQRRIQTSNTFAGVISSRWPSVTIPWTATDKIFGSKKAMTAIKSAIQELEAKTCLRFVKQTNEKAYLKFFVGDGCFSPVGYSGSVNRISLRTECQHHGTALHEIFHSLGFYHEQSRYDRDKYVEIIWKNVPLGARKNFNKYARSQLDDRGVPYDYLSISHYREDTFGGNRKTIRTLDPKYQHLIGASKTLSEKDVQQLSIMYRCNGQKETLPPTLTPPTSRPRVCEDENGLTYCQPLVKYCHRNGSLRAILHRQCYKSCGYCK